MTDLPSGWEWATVDELCIVNPRRFDDPLDDNDLLSIVPMADVDAGTGIIRASRSGRYGDFRKKSLTPFQDEDVIFAKITPCMENGKIALADRLFGGRALGSTEFFVLRSRGAVNPKYLMHFLLQLSVRREAERNMAGAVGQRRVSRHYLESLRVPLPSLSEQRRIVTALEDHLSRLEAGRECVLRAEHQASSFSIALRTAATEGRLVQTSLSLEDLNSHFDRERRLRWNGEFGDRRYKEPADPDLEFAPAAPSGWEVLSLEAVTDPVRLIRYGILMPKVKDGGTIPYVEVKDLAGGALDGKVLHRTSCELDEKFAGARLAYGDVVLAVRGSYERSAVVPEHLTGANISRDVVRIAPLPGLHPEYLHCYLQGSFVKRYLRRHARGVAVKGVNIVAIRALPIVVPPLKIQESIVDDVSRQLSAKEKLAGEIARSKIRANHLRQSLLTEAFMGRLVAQDPEDEPASVLLERIKTERAAVPAPKRRARRTGSKEAEPMSESRARPEAGTRPIIDIPAPSATALRGTPVQETLL